MAEELDTFNKFMVGVCAGKVTLLNPPRSDMNPDEAIMLAAWLVTMAGDFGGEKIKAAMDAVQS